ncbi:MAG TPA: CPBP family intramembrane metalloprotease [Nitrosomonas sp.]|nr:CPBP family intramembrane metalloprotease [Nitrosomonas sp.]
MFKFDLTQQFQNILKLVPRPRKKSGFKVALVCIAVALILTLNRYLGDYRFILTLLHSMELKELNAIFSSLMLDHTDAQLHQLLYWAASIILFYFVSPILLVVFILKERLTEYGFAMHFSWDSYKPYLIMLSIMVPVIAYFSGTQSFLANYPFYTVEHAEQLYPNFVIWQFFYLLQFIALEFLFRGFLLHGTKAKFGFYAIFVMMIPYCMIHFGKPLAETIGAIVAGIALGIMSLKTRSIWPGVMLHYGVAILMDLSVLYRKGIIL